MKASARMGLLSPSMTMAISAKAAELKREGKDVLAFSAGEPDFDTPSTIKEAAIKAINDGHTKYTNVGGTPELLKAIQTKLKRDNNLDYETNEIISSNGAKQSLFNIFAAIINEGDEVIIPSPYWVTYPELVHYHLGTAVVIDTDEETNYKITPQMLKNAITDKTKALVLTTPSNPTGSIYSKEELEGLAEVLKETKITVISDEMYEKLVYGVEFTASASISEDMMMRTITVNGLSKSHAMTGWRFGYCASKMHEINSSMLKLQSQSTSNISSITQQAAISALLGEADRDVEEMCKAFEKRRDYVYKAFNKIEGLSAVKPEGAFYIFVNHSTIEEDSLKFASDLLEETGVAVVPGIGFGSAGHFRFSFATSMENIQEGINRIQKFIND